MKRHLSIYHVATVLLVGAALAGVAQSYTDPFDGPDLADMWTFRTPDGNDNFAFEKGWFVFDIEASQDLYIKGVDLAPMLLMDPPADDASFRIETLVDVVLDQGQQQPASHAGLLFFNEAEWVYSLWGPYANTDVRLEDVIGGAYRWRNDTGVGVNTPIDSDLWLRIVKTGETLEFFWKTNEKDDWESAGTDSTRGAYYKKGAYKIGLFLKNWGGSVPTRTAFDYFHSPEIAGLSVDPLGKAATMWGALKRR